MEAITIVTQQIRQITTEFVQIRNISKMLRILVLIGEFRAKKEGEAKDYALVYSLFIHKITHNS
jgi:hypothetical protein